MQFRNKFAAWTAIATLGVAGLFAAETAQGEHHWRGGHPGRSGAFMATQLNLTDAQKAQAKSIFQDARQSAQPIRQQLMQTRQALRDAIKTNNTAQIQQLSATQGSQMGQLTAIRSQAFAKVYQTLTPEQQQKAAELEKNFQARRQARHQNQEQKQAQ